MTPASTDEDARRPRGDGLTMLVPSSWWTVDLKDDDARRRSIARLVGEQVGKDDAAAALRADLRRRLIAAADQAVAAGGILMAVSLMRIGDRPVPATMTVYRAPGLTLDERGVTLLAEALATAGATVEAADTPQGPVVRRVLQRTGDPDLGADAVPMLVADYWLDVGDGTVVNATFSSPTVQLTDPLLDLFDTVVSSIEASPDAGR